MEIKRKSLTHQLQCLKDKELLGEFSGEDRERKKGVAVEKEKMAFMEEISWTVLWMKEGNKRTKDFHHKANTHRRNNDIEMLQDSNNVISEQEAIKDQI